jgi:hypothetical protein
MIAADRAAKVRVNLERTFSRCLFLESTDRREPPQSGRYSRQNSAQESSHA